MQVRVPVAWVSRVLRRSYVLRPRVVFALAVVRPRPLVVRAVVGLGSPLFRATASSPPALTVPWTMVGIAIGRSICLAPHVSMFRSAILGSDGMVDLVSIVRFVRYSSILFLARDDVVDLRL